MPDDHASSNTRSSGLFPSEHRRILVLMAVLGAVGGTAGAIFISARSGAGIVLGVAIAFVNYFWLRHSLNKLVASTAEGERPRISGLRYLGRYLVIGGMIAAVYVSEIVPIVPLVLGIAAFGFAVTVEGLIRIFTSFSNRKDFS